MVGTFQRWYVGKCWKILRSWMNVSSYLGSGLNISPWKGGSLTILHIWKAKSGSYLAPYSWQASKPTNCGWHTCTNWSSTIFWHLLVKMKKASTPWWVLEGKWERTRRLERLLEGTSIHTSEVCSQVKIWNLEKRDGGNPLCTRIFPAIPGTEPTVVSCLTVHENLNFMAIGKQKANVTLRDSLQIFFRVASAPCLRCFNEIILYWTQAFEILKFGVGKHSVLFFEKESVSTDFYVNHRESWVWEESLSLPTSASNGLFPFLFFLIFSVSLKWCFLFSYRFHRWQCYTEQRRHHPGPA